MHQPDTIHIRGLRLKCHIGVTEKERGKKQNITADITLRCDLRAAGGSDRLEDTVDYSALAGKLLALAAGEEFCLLEALARRIAEVCLAERKISKVTVKIAKKNVLPQACSAEIEITRKNPHHPR
ncbi:MAG: dihydroneopterin aldolase [Kiritimatiellae bacterium]|nr:dihydroneopterin aldolase [Kiritimatiellia bacterium]